MQHSIARSICWVSLLFCATGFGQTPTLAQREQAAQTYLRQGKPALAIPEFEAVLALDPKNLDAQANLGVLLFFAGKPAEAEPHLEAALGIAPGQAKLRALLGSCEHRTGKLDAARKDLLAAFPALQDPKIQRQTGLEIVEVDTALNDLPAATAILNQLKAAQPTDPQVLYAAYRVYTDLAQESLLDLSVAAPESAQVHQAMAHELLRDRNYDAAITNLRAALKADPNLPGGHFELAEVLHKSTKPADQAEAEAEYRLALQQSPQDTATLTRLGDLASDRNDHTAATDDYKRALALEPNSVDAKVGLAHELTEANQPDAALPLLQQAIQEDPTDVTAHFRLSALYRKLHRPDDAKREIAEYERLKTMKDKLHTFYQDMRTNTPQAGDAQP